MGDVAETTIGDRGNDLVWLPSTAELLGDGVRYVVEGLAGKPRKQAQCAVEFPVGSSHPTPS